MKKQLIATMLLIIIVLCLCGCGKKKYQATLGNWEIQTYAVNGIDTELSECEYPQMSMADDGTFVFINGATSYSGTFDIKGNNVTAELGEKKINMTLTNNNLYITATYELGKTNYMLVFKKVTP